MLEVTGMYVYICLSVYLLSMHSYAYTHMTTQADYFTVYCKLFKVKSFVIFVYQLVTMKLSSKIAIMPPCNRVWSHKTSVQP